MVFNLKLAFLSFIFSCFIMVGKVHALPSLLASPLERVVVSLLLQ